MEVALASTCDSLIGGEATGRETAQTSYDIPSATGSNDDDHPDNAAPGARKESTTASERAHNPADPSILPPHPLPLPPVPDKQAPIPSFTLPFGDNNISATNDNDNNDDNDICNDDNVSWCVG